MADSPKVPPEVLERLRRAAARLIQRIEARRATGIIEVTPKPRECGLLRHLRGEPHNERMAYQTTLAEAVARVEAAEKIKLH